jgi:putative phosphoribosyl transferase
MVTMVPGGPAGPREGLPVEVAHVRAARYRAHRPRERLDGWVAVVVNDGVAPPGWQTGIAGAADELICVATPADFFTIGQFYADFSQTTDEEVIACLEQAAKRVSQPQGRGALPR